MYQKAPAVPIQPHTVPPSPRPKDIEKRHWAEKIFENPPHSTTALKHRRA
jgi:hypothetical protein